MAYSVYRLQKAETYEEQKAAAEAIKAFERDAKPAVAKLVELLGDRSLVFRHLVEGILCGLGPTAKEAVPELMKLLKKEAAIDPNCVIRILESIGPDAKDAIPAVRLAVLEWIAVANKDSTTPSLYLDELYKLGPNVLPLILEILDAPGEVGKLHCIRQIERFGKDARKATPKLRELLKHKDPSVRFESAVMLWKIEKNPSVVPTLAEFLNGDSLSYAMSAVEELGNIGPAAKVAIPSLQNVAATGSAACFAILCCTQESRDGSRIYHAKNSANSQRFDRLDMLSKLGYRAREAIGKIETPQAPIKDNNRE